MLWNEGTNQQAIDRQASRTGHQWRDQYGRHAIANIVDRARRHDARNGAGVARQQRNE